MNDGKALEGKTFQELRAKAEQLLDGCKTRSTAIQVDELARLIHELENRHVQLELQCEELLRTRNDLEPSGDEHAGLYESLPVACITLNEKGIIERANKAAGELLDTDEDLAGRGFSQFIDPRDLPLFSSCLNGLSSHRRASGPVELRLAGFETSPVHVRLEATVERDEQGTPRRRRVTLVDITRCKLAEDALRRWREPMLTRTERIAGVGSWEWDIAEDAVTWSEGLFHIFRLNPAEGAPTWAEHSALYHPDDMARLTAAVDLAVSDGTPYRLELRAWRKDGELRNLLAWGFPERDSDGRVVRLHGSVQDITERKRAEAGLQESEQRYRTIFERNLNPIAVIDTQGRYLDANEAFLSFVEETRETLLGMRTFDFAEPEKRPRRESVHRPVWETGGTVETDYLIRGDIKTLELTITPFTYKGVDAVVGVGKDITDRKRSEKALRESEEKFHRLTEVIPEVFWLTSVEDFETIEYVSPAFETIWGEPPEKLYADSRFWMESIIEEDRDRVGEAFEAFVEGRRNLNVEFRIVRADGSIRWIHDQGYAVYDETGAPRRLAGLAQDITERKQAEKEQHLRSLVLDQIQDRVTVTDLEGHITYINDAECRMMGMTRDEVIGRHISMYGEDPEAGATQAEILRETLARGAWQGEVVNYDAGGRPVFLHARTRVVKDFQGNPIALCGVSTDITERKRMEQELRQADKMKALGTLAGGIAHDFNNILSIILGNAELAMHDLPESSAPRGNLEEVRRASLRARDLVTQILFFARQKEQAVSDVRTEPIAKECLKMLRASIPTTVDIQLSLGEDLPRVHADPSQIQQVIMNLCTNAGQVMEAEGGRLELRMEAADLESPLDTATGPIPEGRYVRIRVLDTGPGMSPEELERIFEPFYTTKGVGEGTGLGLAVVHGIVTGAGGGIVVESETGRGTAFTVYLPASDREEAGGVTGDEPELPGGSERILFVDDEPMILSLGRQMLERLGYEVEARASGAEALACFEEDPEGFDLVLTDMSMPGLRGDRLAERVLEIRPDIPVILSTGYSRQISEERAEEIGIRAFVMKPLTANELAGTVREVLDGA